MLECERAKIRLSQVDRTELNTLDLRPALVVDDREIEVTVTITRSDLESRIEPLIDNSVAICRAALHTHRDVSEILLVGGPTVMPIVRDKLRALGVAINSQINPMTAVVTGAAFYAMHRATTQVHQACPRLRPRGRGCRRVHHGRAGATGSGLRAHV